MKKLILSLTLIVCSHFAKAQLESLYGFEGSIMVFDSLGNVIFYLKEADLPKYKTMKECDRVTAYSQWGIPFGYYEKRKEGAVLVIGELDEKR